MEHFAVNSMGHMTVEVKIPAIKSQQVPQTPSPVEQISLKFRVQVKCRHFLVAEDNTVSSSMRQHKFRKLPFEILHIPIRVFKRDDEALQKFLSMQFETHYRESVDVKIVADAIKDKWIEITKENGSWSMFGSVFPLTITIKLWGIVTFHERELSVMTEIEDAMVPTSNSAIEEMVERAKFEDIEADNQSCVICLEKMRREEKSVIILKMPCLHLFHEDCIKKWLGKSHYCPICRFQMPTN